MTSNPLTASSTSTTGTDRRRTRTFVGGVIVAGCLAIGLGVAAAQQPAARSESVDQTMVAQWARDQHLSGLSPNSVTRTAATPTAIDQSAIADWARRNDVTGFSPSSLGVGSD